MQILKKTKICFFQYSIICVTHQGFRQKETKWGNCCQNYRLKTKNSLKLFKSVIVNERIEKKTQFFGASRKYFHFLKYRQNSYFLVNFCCDSLNLVAFTWLRKSKQEFNNIKRIYEHDILCFCLCVVDT